MYVQDTLGSLLQGVSQQPERLRLPGQVTEQINMVSDVTLGLTSRPSTRFVDVLANCKNGMRFHQVQYSGVDYIVGHKAKDLRIWGLDGTPFKVTYQDAHARRYIDTQMRFHVYEKSIYAVNRDKTVEMDDDEVGYDHHAAFVTALGGAYSRTYTIELTFSDGSVVRGQYETPSGDEEGDAEWTSSEYIMRTLKICLEDGTKITKISTDYVNDDDTIESITSDPLPDGVVLHLEGDVLGVKHTSAISVHIEDGEAGQVLRVCSDTVDKRADLPRFAFEGTIVQVTGDEAREDDFYLRFNAKGVAVEGNGYGKEGVWEEWYNPTQPTLLNLRTMPHVITKSGTTFTVRRGAWKGRRVGDSTSNPYPTFINNKIRDISGLDSRLVFVAGNSCVMSRVNNPLDFFRKTAVTQVDSDPIDIQSTKEGSLQLDWIVPFDRGLILLSDPGNSQFIVTGGGLTPANASMVLTTEYEMYGSARPATTGRTMVFPFKSGSFAGVKEFFTNDSVATHGADNLTQVQDRYINGLVDYMDASKNFNLITFQSNSTNATDKQTLWVYRYLWEGTTRVQSSWSKWRFAEEVIWHFYDNNKVYFIFKQSSNVYNLEYMDLNKVDDQGVGYYVCLDGKQTETVDSNFQITLTYPGASFVHKGRGSDKGHRVVPRSETTRSPTRTVYTFRRSHVDVGDQLVCGRTFRRVVKPTMPQVKNNNGQTISSAHITLSKFIVHLEDTGKIGFKLNSPYRSSRDFTPWEYPLDDDPRNAGARDLLDDLLDAADAREDAVLMAHAQRLHTGPVDVPWGERADWSNLTIHTDDVRPTTILEIEWEGQITGAKRRL